MQYLSRVVSSQERERSALPDSTSSSSTHISLISPLEATTLVWTVARPRNSSSPADGTVKWNYYKSGPKLYIFVSSDDTKKKSMHFLSRFIALCVEKSAQSGKARAFIEKKILKALDVI